MPCSWLKCTRGAAFDRVDTDGKVWARLCVDHNVEAAQAFDVTRNDYSAPHLVSVWIKAGGGAEATHQRVFGPFARLHREASKKAIAAMEGE